ncbi:DUF58 domain-containing protein [Natrarchaeobius chitinivorans]|uniref:DUF58 domain-containing protein n=1 Tax=Natrarchaeobius chitinivorans TaxID=1679083 RepID=A0A3N6NBI8_NATCH|nr:DUF58 domain-containing protein [Natrarchaeobius chitinivorans]RQG96012.1 DUF58 domain-containing protein [Natrarchaeobius chitinivorans]
MRPTRRTWGVGLLALSTAVLAVVVSHPLLLGATVMIGVWILVRQYRFYQELSRMCRTLTFEQTPERSVLRTGETTTVTVRAALEPSQLALTFTAGLPTATVNQSGPSSTVLELEPESTAGSKTIRFECPVAGRHQFDRATVTATDGWFRETLDVGPAPTITVDARGPREVHVGSGGDRVSIVQGQHSSDQSGSGLTPAELREYVPGDNTDRIDWKATARLATPHIRTYEANTDRPTILVVDHRSTLDTGPAGETKLDYLRDVALSIVASARQLDDPVGLVAVGNSGITVQTDLTTDLTQYRRIRQQLFDLEATIESPPDHGRRKPGPGTDTSEPPRSTTQTPVEGPRRWKNAPPTRARVAVRKLEHGDRDVFSRTLGPFYRQRQTYQTRLESEPLRSALRTTLRTQQRKPWTILFTDDSDPVALREAVQIARTNGSYVLVLITPSVLFEPGSLATVEESYDRYVAFEELRRDLDRLEGVTALEVAPREQLATVLAAGHTHSTAMPGSRSDKPTGGRSDEPTEGRSDIPTGADSNG